MKEYKELLEDLASLALIAERRNEPTVPLEEVKRKLEEKWTLEKRFAPAAC